MRYELSRLFPYLLPLCALAVPAIAILCDYFKQRRIIDHLHRERLAAIEKGLDLSQLPSLSPAAFGHEAYRPPKYLLRGLLWTLIGGATAGVLFLKEDLRTASFGLIPAAIGLAYLIFAACSRTASPALPAPSTAAPSPVPPPIESKSPPAV